MLRSACRRSNARARPSAEFLHARPRTGRRSRRHGAGVREVVVHLSSHALDLLVDGGRDLVLAGAAGALSLLRQDGERRLQTVGEIAGLGDGALNRLLAMIEQRVQVVHERLDLGGIGAVHPPLATGSQPVQTVCAGCPPMPGRLSPQPVPPPCRTRP